MGRTIDLRAGVMSAITGRPPEMSAGIVREEVVETTGPEERGRLGIRGVTTGPGAIIRVGIRDPTGLEVAQGTILGGTQEGIDQEGPILKLPEAIGRAAGTQETTGQEEAIRELLEATGRVGTRVGIVRVGLLEADHRGILRDRMPIDLLRDLRILMRDFRRAVIDHKGRGLSSLNQDLNRGRRLPGHVRAALAGVTMGRRRGRRAIVAEPVLVAAATGEVNADEAMQS